MFHFAPPELNGSGDTTWTPGLTRSLQFAMCFGFPGRTTKATTESATIPPCGSFFVQLLSTRPACVSVSTSSAFERKAMSAGCPATIARACEPDGPYDCVNETPLPADVDVHFAISFCTTGFGVEKATRLTVVPACLACAALAQTRTTGRTSEKRMGRRMTGCPAFPIDLVGIGRTDYCHKEKCGARENLSAFRNEIRERRLLEDAAHLRPELEPDVAQLRRRARVFELVRPHAAHGRDRPLELADHVGDRDLLGRPREPVAALRAALARHEPTAPQLGEDALEELRRDLLRRGELLGRGQAVGMGGELHHRPERVVDSGRDPHALIVIPTTAGARGRTRGADGAGRRGCRPGLSRGSCVRAAPGSSAGRRRRRAGASRMHVAAGGDWEPRGAACSCRAAGRARRGTGRRRRRFQHELPLPVPGAPRGGSGRPTAPPP